MPTGEIPAVIDQKTRAPLVWIAAAAVAAFAAGGGYALGQAKALAVEERVAKAERRLDEHSESLHDKDKRIALVERAVLSLERLAAGKK